MDFTIVLCSHSSTVQCHLTAPFNTQRSLCHGAAVVPIDLFERIFEFSSEGFIPTNLNLDAGAEKATARLDGSCKLPKCFLHHFVCPVNSCPFTTSPSVSHCVAQHPQNRLISGYLCCNPPILSFITRIKKSISHCQDQQISKFKVTSPVNICK